MARKILSVALSAAIVLVFSIGGLWYFGVEIVPTTDQSLATARFTPNLRVRENRLVSVEGVLLGMSMHTVKELHRDVYFRSSGQREPIAEFTADGVKHTLWFAGGPSTAAVYRIRRREYSEHLPTDVIHKRFAELYGQPAAVDCRQGSKVSRQGLCYLKWVTRDGVSIEVSSRNLIERSGRDRTELIITFTDVLIANKILATRQPGRA